MPLTLIRQDITQLHVDAVVNAANERLRAGGGVCGAIFNAAGREELQAACDQIGHVDTGSAVATPGFKLPARHIIHTAGPIWRGGTMGEPELLASCYRSSMVLARKLGDESIAFPLISAGIFGYPPEEALKVATDTIRAYLKDDPDLEVTLCLFDRRATRLSRTLFGQISEYVDDNYVDSSPYRRNERQREQDLMLSQPFGTGIPDAAPSAPAAPQYAAAPSYPDSAREAEPAARESALERIKRRLGKRPKHEAAKPSVQTDAMPMYEGSAASMPAATSLEDMLAHLDAPFSETLFSMIDQRGLTDAQVYARANLSRQYFSKLRAGSINPSKRAVLSLAIALELSLDETRLLLER
ncbi:MAG: macro domain-containing protein, partial [Atopobiaceae bacterium]|nr:macro domain-containing protein [Atopobiaceae bacterium]